MRDLAFVAFLFAFIGVGFRKPFLFVLCFCYIDIVAPQRLSYFLINSIPISLIVFILAIIGWLAFDDKRDTRWSGRQTLMLILLFYCWMTTMSADFPVEALDKWGWVWKALVWAMLLLILVIYLTAIFMTKLIGQASRLRENTEVQLYFGSIPKSMFTLFQLVTLEGRNEVARDMMDEYVLGLEIGLLFLN